MTPLIGIALDVGATVLGKVLRQRGGAAGTVAADIADTAVRSIANTLGVEPTEEAIADHFEKDPYATTEAIRTVNADLGAMAQAASDAVQSYHRVIAADAQSEKLLNRIWRPLNGILFAVACFALVLSFVRLMWVGDVQTIANASVSYGFLGTVLGTWAGVVGVYVWKRTDEKKASAA
ncbi:3TM-type holin [uncultured Roseibium sp.]|uniref:3TM-type holin n=1 Tax=uncultured Roseibium sp. TaxID=1936171 RepID=UPI003217A476